MNLSRSLLLKRNIFNKVKISRNPTLISTRLHASYYRAGVEKHPKSVMICANLVMGSTWTWMLYKSFTEPDHLFGEYDYPDPSKWTDQELGIPEEE